MHAFITIGSTEFDALIAETLSPRTLKALKAKGYETLTVQCGNSTFEQAALVAKGETATFSLEGLAIELWKFKPSLREEYEKADLIVSHAGSGTIVEILRLPKPVPKPLIVVPNSKLLHNHQEELSQALAVRGHLKSSTIENLAETITQFDRNTLVPFPAYDSTRFVQMLDEAMGFI